MSECRMLSIDASTKSTGIALYINGNLQNTKLFISKTKDADDRVDDMISQLYRYIDDVNPAIIVIETPVAVKQNIQTQLLLAQILGAVRGKCIENEICFCTYRPSEWRRRFDGIKPRKRVDLKQWAIDTVSDLFNIEVSDDEAEAILIGTAYIKEFS